MDESGADSQRSSAYAFRPHFYHGLVMATTVKSHLRQQLKLKVGASRTLYFQRNIARDVTGTFMRMVARGSLLEHCRHQNFSRVVAANFGEPLRRAGGAPELCFSNELQR